MCALLPIIMSTGISPTTIVFSAFMFNACNVLRTGSGAGFAFITLSAPTTYEI